MHLALLLELARLLDRNAIGELVVVSEGAGVEWLALSSVAAGSDILFARSALALGMGWEAVLPLPATEFRRDFPDAQWKEVEELLAQAEHIRVISERGRREDAYLDGDEFDVSFEEAAQPGLEDEFDEEDNRGNLIVPGEARPGNRTIGDEVRRSQRFVSV